MGPGDLFTLMYLAKKVREANSPLDPSEAQRLEEGRKQSEEREKFLKQEKLEKQETERRFIENESRWKAVSAMREKRLYPDNLTRSAQGGFSGKTLFEQTRIRDLVRFIRQGGERPDPDVSPSDFLLHTLESRFGWEKSALEPMRKNMEKSSDDFSSVSYGQWDINREECGRLHAVGPVLPDPDLVFTGPVRNYGRPGPETDSDRTMIDFNALIDKAEREGCALPGLEYLQRACRDPQAVWPWTVHGSWIYLPGTLFRSDDGRWHIFRAKWEKEESRFSIGADAVEDGVPNDAVIFFSRNDEEEITPDRR